MDNHTAINQRDSAPESEIWIPLKEASTTANRCDTTLKRAIKAGNLVGRRAGAGHNASYEIRQDSLIAWSKTDSPAAEGLPAKSPSGTEATANPGAHQPQTAGAIPAPPQQGDSETAKSKSEFHRKAKKIAMPKEARLLRRWKNNMRGANQEQTLAMIQWLSGRLKNTHGMRRKEAKTAVRDAKRRGKDQVAAGNVADKVSAA